MIHFCGNLTHVKYITYILDAVLAQFRPTFNYIFVEFETPKENVIIPHCVFSLLNHTILIL